MGEVIGLDFSALESLFKLLEIPTDEWKFVFESIMFCFEIEQEEAEKLREERKKLDH